MQPVLVPLPELDALGRDAQAHLAMAEMHAINGVWVAAIEQLQAAQRTRQLDFYASSQVDARLREFRARFFEEREEVYEPTFVLNERICETIACIRKTN